jgi:hypothetical protein
MLNIIFFVFVCLIWDVKGFIGPCRRFITTTSSLLKMKAENEETVFEFDIPLGDGYEDVGISLRPLFEHSFMFIVQVRSPSGRTHISLTGRYGARLRHSYPL